MRLRLAIFAAAAFGVGCPRAADQAAKARIFSPEDPPKFVTRAAEDLDPAHLDQSAEHIRRVFTMSALEAGERLGPHQLESTLEFHWTGGERNIDLDEKHTLTLGTHGDFTARLDDGDKLGQSRQGMEMIRAQGKVYARSRFQKFRERANDRGAANRYEEQVYDVLGTAYELFDGRVALSPDGTDTVAGRKVFRYKVTLAEKQPALETVELPPLSPPKGGFDAHLTRELELDKKKAPRSLTGTLSVDAQTSVPLEAHLLGTLEAPGEPGKLARLSLNVNQRVLRVSPDLVIAAPSDAGSEDGRAPSIAAALERFDLPRNSDRNDAGSADEEPDEGG